MIIGDMNLWDKKVQGDFKTRDLRSDKDPCLTNTSQLESEMTNSFTLNKSKACHLYLMIIGLWNHFKLEFFIVMEHLSFVQINFVWPAICIRSTTNWFIRQEVYITFHEYSVY